MGQTRATSHCGVWLMWGSRPALPNRFREVSKEVMANNSNMVFWLGVVLAVILGVAGANMNADTGNILKFGLMASAVLTGWYCVSEGRAKDYAIAAVALWFLTSGDFGNAAGSLEGMQFVGSWVGGIFGQLTTFVLAVAAVGMLKSLVNQAAPK